MMPGTTERPRADKPMANDFYRTPRWTICLLAAILTFPSGSRLARAQSSVSWSELAPGLAIALWEPGNRCEDPVPSMVLVRIDPDRYRFGVHHYRSEGLSDPLTLEDWQKRLGALSLINSGLFLADYSYLGLLFQGGRSIGGKRHRSWQGLFVAEPTLSGMPKAGILDLAHDRFREDQPLYREAAQSLMLLDRTGKPRVRHSGKSAYQSVIGEQKDGMVLLGRTTTEVGLWELAVCLREEFPLLRQAMALDGGSSSALMVDNDVLAGYKGLLKAAPWRRWVDGSTGGAVVLPSVIAVFPRDKPEN